MTTPDVSLLDIATFRRWRYAGKRAGLVDDHAAEDQWPSFDGRRRAPGLAQRELSACCVLTSRTRPAAAGRGGGGATGLPARDGALITARQGLILAPSGLAERGVGRTVRSTRAVLAAYARGGGRVRDRSTRLIGGRRARFASTGRTSPPPVGGPRAAALIVVAVPTCWYARASIGPGRTGAPESGPGAPGLAPGVLFGRVLAAYSDSSGRVVAAAGPLGRSHSLSPSARVSCRKSPWIYCAGAGSATAATSRSAVHTPRYTAAERHVRKAVPARRHPAGDGAVPGACAGGHHVYAQIRPPGVARSARVREAARLHGRRSSSRERAEIIASTSGCPLSPAPSSHDGVAQAARLLAEGRTADQQGRGKAC